MTAYYCDLALDFVDRSGANSGANVLTGPGGFDAAIHGQGAATALVAGDTLYLKGTGDLSRLVLIDCNGTDVSAWAAGNVVRNKDGAGDDWTGVVVRANDDPAGGMTADDMVLVQLAAGKDSSDVALADGIENTTLAESADPLAAVTTPGIQVDLNSGDTTTGNIHVIGCSADWTARGAQAVLDGVGIATDCVLNNDRDRWTFEYLTFQNAINDGYDSGGTPLYVTLRHCLGDNNGGIGLDLAVSHRALRCIGSNNTGYNVHLTSGCGLFCRANDGSSAGINTETATFIGCLSHGNATYCYRLWNAGCSLVNCIGDGSAGNSGVILRLGKLTYTLVGNRFTNNADHGIEMQDAVDDNYVEDCNVFFNNTNGDLQNILPGLHSYGDAHVLGPATSSGYTKRTLLVAFDNGVNMTNAEVGDAVTDGTWTGLLRTVPTGDVTGTFELDTVAGGNPANNDALTLGGVETCDINGAPTIQDTGANATNWDILAGAEIDGTGADSEVDLFWDGGDSEGAAWLTAGLPREIVAGGGATRLIGGVLA